MIILENTDRIFDDLEYNYSVGNYGITKTIYGVFDENDNETVGFGARIFVANLPEVIKMRVKAIMDEYCEDVHIDTDCIYCDDYSSLDNTDKALEKIFEVLEVA